MMANFKVEDHVWKRFKLKTGNASDALRGFVRAYINEDEEGDEVLLERLAERSRRLDEAQKAVDEVKAELERRKAIHRAEEAQRAADIQYTKEATFRANSSYLINKAMDAESRRG